MSFAIRPAAAADAARLARLNARVHAQHVRRRPEFFKPTQPDELTAWFRSRLEKRGTRSWLAEVECEAVGYLLMSEHQRPENVFCHARHWHEIDHIGVEPTFRRRGIGRALIQTALAAAAGTGARDVEIASWAFNTDAHAMFRRCGFAPRLLRFDATLPRQ
jgi:GNAT superfamily N-acetyltransferase